MALVLVESCFPVVAHPTGSFKVNDDWQSIATSFNGHTVMPLGDTGTAKAALRPRQTTRPCFGTCGFLLVLVVAGLPILSLFGPVAIQLGNQLFNFPMVDFVCRDNQRVFQGGDAVRRRIPSVSINVVCDYLGDGIDVGRP